MPQSYTIIISQGQKSLSTYLNTYLPFID